MTSLGVLSPFPFLLHQAKTSPGRNGSLAGHGPGAGPGHGHGHGHDQSHGQSHGQGGAQGHGSLNQEDLLNSSKKNQVIRKSVFY